MAMIVQIIIWRNLLNGIKFSIQFQATLKMQMNWNEISIWFLPECYIINLFFKSAYTYLVFVTFGGSRSSWWKSLSRGLTASKMLWLTENEGWDIPGGHSIWPSNLQHAAIKWQGFSKHWCNDMSFQLYPKLENGKILIGWECDEPQVWHTGIPMWF